MKHGRLGIKMRNMVDEYVDKPILSTFSVVARKRGKVQMVT